MRITEVASNTYLLDFAHESDSPLGEIVYLIVDERPVLIEPGSTTTCTRLLSASHQRGLEPASWNFIIPTHIHVDHGGGVGYLASKLPQATILLHPQGAPHLANPEQLIEATKSVFGPDFERSFGPILAVPERQIQAAQDGQTICAGRHILRVIFAPGHASHHIAIFDEFTQGLFCGEALGIVLPSMPEFPLPAAVPPFDLDLYLDTIDKLSKLRPKWLFYSHCGVYEDSRGLIEKVRHNALAFGSIIHESWEAGEKGEQIWKRLTDYVANHFPGADLPAEFHLTLSGYISYFERSQSRRTADRRWPWVTP